MEDAPVVPKGTGACTCLRVVFGAGGNLARTKFIPAVTNDMMSVPKSERWKWPTLWADMIPIDDFGEYLTTRLQTESPATLKLEAWADLLATAEFKQVGQTAEEARELFAEVVQFLRHNPKATVQFYLAVPYGANIRILEWAAHYLGDAGVGNRLYFFSEKPLEITPDALLTIKGLLTKMGVAEDHFGIVEHFALKPFFEEALCPESPLAKLMTQIGTRRWKKVLFVVKEKIGTEGRVYDGIGVDSMLNHHAFMEAVVFMSLLRELRSDSDQRKGVLLAQILCELRRRMVLPSGQYFVCRDDYNPPSSKPHSQSEQYVPTGIHLRYDVRLGEGEMVEVESTHTKNTDEKVTRARIEGDNWSLDLLMDGFKKGIRGFGWRLVEDDKIVEEHFEALPLERACGYPEVARAVRLKQMGKFMPSEFQRCSNELFMPLLLLLDQTPIGERIWFDKGENVMARVNADVLRPLHHRAEALA